MLAVETELRRAAIFIIDRLVLREGITFIILPTPFC